MTLRLRHNEKKMSPKEAEARKRGRRLAVGSAIGTGLIVAFLVGKCSTEPRMDCPEPTPVYEKADFNLEKKKPAKSLCGNGKVDRGEFDVVVTIEGKEGESATFKRTKVKVDECRRSNPFFCAKDCGKGKGKPGRTRPSSKKMTMVMKKGLPKCPPEVMNSRGFQGLLGRTGNAVKRRAGDVRSGIGSNPSQHIGFTFAVDVDMHGRVSNARVIEAKCGGKKCPRKANVVRITGLKVNGVKVGAPPQECRLVFPVPLPPG